MNRRRSFPAEYINAESAKDAVLATLFLIIVSAVIGGCVELIDHVSGVVK